MGLVLCMDTTEEVSYSEELSEEISDEIESVEKDEASSKPTSSQDMPLPDPSQFPLLYSIFSSQPHSNMDMLLHEVVKFHHHKTIRYTKGNNTDGTLIALPGFRSLDKYMDYFKIRNLLWLM